MTTEKWHTLSVKQTINKLNTTKNGLTLNEAEKRLNKYGPNQIQETKKTTALEIFINQFKSILIFILIAAMIVSVFLNEIVDAVVIGIIILLKNRKSLTVLMKKIP